jgi:Flp pilus assembly protein TadD
MIRLIGGLCLIVTLAACSSGGLGASKDSPFAPGRDTRGQDVDGLIVGHRLMQAGQYELALKAYTRGARDTGLTVDVLTALGSANLKLGRLGQSERWLRAAIEEDETFVPAWNNLGVLLLEQNDVAQSAQMFKRAFALDSGESDEIRDNLRLVLSKLENPSYNEPQEKAKLVRRGTGDYMLLQTPI